MEGREKKNRATLLNKFDYYFEQMINEINKFVWKKRFDSARGILLY